MMNRTLILILLFVLQGLGCTLRAQGLAPEPVPKFRFGIPIPQVADHGVKEAVLIKYEDWLADSARFKGARTFQLDKTGKEQIVYEFLPNGKVSRALRIFPYGVHINADWEQLWSYDSLGRISHIRGRYVTHDDGTYVFPDSTSFLYDAEGRPLEILELKNYRYTDAGVVEESGWRTRYTYLRDGKVAAREKCRTRMSSGGGMKCGVDSVDFDGQGRLARVRWIVETYRDSLGNYPPEREYEYDAEGKLTIEREYGFGTEFYRTEYTYDASGHVLSATRLEMRVQNKNPNSLRFTYRADGLPDRVQQIGLSEFDFKILYEFH